MSGNASNVYEAHLNIVKTLGDKLLKLAAMSPHANQARDLKDLATAYAVAVDKLGTFNQTLTLADGSATVPLKDRL